MDDHDDDDDDDEVSLAAVDVIVAVNRLHIRFVALNFLPYRLYGTNFGFVQRFAYDARSYTSDIS